MQSDERSLSAQISPPQPVRLQAFGGNGCVVVGVAGVSVFGGGYFSGLQAQLGTGQCGGT